LALDGKVGEYIVIARRSGDTWYIGGITGQNRCDIDLDLSILGEGTWKMTLFTDGINAERHAEDYKKVETEVNGKLTVHMSKGGGFALKLSK
jgi:alpha-glucosidase